MVTPNPIVTSIMVTPNPIVFNTPVVYYPVNAQSLPGSVWSPRPLLDVYYRVITLSLLWLMWSAQHTVVAVIDLKTKSRIFFLKDSTSDTK